LGGWTGEAFSFGSFGSLDASGLLGCSTDSDESDELYFGCEEEASCSLIEDSEFSLSFSSESEWLDADRLSDEDDFSAFFAAG
jgi:hypothetical protein